MTSALRDALARTDAAGITAAEKLVEALLARALRGDLGAIREILDRVDGKVRPLDGDVSDVTLRVEWAAVGDDEPTEDSPAAHAAARASRWRALRAEKTYAVGNSPADLAGDDEAGEGDSV